MKNNIKKIIMVLVLGFLFVGGQSAFANNVFNGQSGDCNPAVGIGIYPNNIPRDSNGCWTATSISANAGDTINVAMYYHNNTNSSLNGVSGSIAKSGSGQNYTFIGKMSSSGNGSQLIGTVSLNLSSSQTLTYDSTHLMKGANAVINTQETASFNMDGGQIPVGSVPSGWDDYGEILVVYKVGSTIPQNNCSINNFHADDTSIDQGDSTELNWDTDNCDHVNITYLGNNLNPSDTASVSPSSTRTYVLKAYDYNGNQDATDSVTIYVDQNNNYNDYHSLHSSAI